MFLEGIRETFAIVADVHGNLEAFTAVLNHMKALDIKKTLYLGDVVGYGANPSECLALQRENEFQAIKGNHERFATKESRPGSKELREGVQGAIKWTRKQISRQDMKYIKQLPDSLIVGNDFLFVHGSPKDRDEYVISYEAAKVSLEYFAAKYPKRGICFFGHSHRPCIIGRTVAMSKIHKTRTEHIARGEPYLINPGSVGQPRDKCPDASYAVFDPKKWDVTFFRVPYDINGAMRKIITVGLPQAFAARLRNGT